MSPHSPDARAAAAAAQARRLREAAVVIRRHARGLRYHPVTGQRPQPSPGLSSALEEIEQTVIAIQRAAGERAADEHALAAAAGSAIEAVRAGHAAVDQGAQLTLAALTVLREWLQHLERASLDAPYGRGAPTRHHPGALATMVAERAEDLALALEVVTITTANLYRGPQAQAAAAGH